MKLNEAIDDFLNLCGMKGPRRIITIKEAIPNRWVRFFKQLILVDPKHPKNRQYFPSQISLSDERRRHLTYHCAIIHPFSLARVFWEFFMVGYILINLIFTLLFIPLQRPYILLVLDIPLALNICINFITGYTDINSRTVILDPKRIRYKYLKDYFVLEMLPIIPWYLLLRLKQNPELFLLAGFTRSFFRLCNLPTFYRYLTNFYSYCRVYSFYKLIINGTITYFIIFCFMSNVLLNDYCIIEYLEGNRDVICETPFPSERFDLMKMFMFECYSAMALIGRPVNRELNISTAMLHCLMSYFVTAFYTFLVSMVAVYFRRAYGYSKRKFHKLDKEIQEYLKIHTANRTLKNSVQAFFHYEFKRGYYNKKKITRDLSSEMKDELTLREACNIADKLGILGIVSVPGLLALGSCLVSEFYYSGETIYNEGEPSKSMYIVASGKLASYKKSVINGREVQLENGHQQDGDWLGEAGFLKRAPSLFTVKAILNSQLYRLDHEHLSELKTTCPKLIQQFEEIMELKEIFDKLT